MADLLLCSIDECCNTRVSFGYCVAHYTRLRRHGSPTAGRKSPIPKIGACSIDDCGAPIVLGGMCSSHYQRKRLHGDPLAGGTAKGEAASFVGKALAYEGDDCLFWPYSDNSLGYGTVSIDGATEYVHRIVCLKVNGEPPTPSHEAAHSCGNGSSGCVTGRHLSWKTRTDNQADRIGHGTHIVGEKHGMSKLKECDISTVRALKGKESQRTVAERFGVTQSHISEIQRGKKWGWLS